MIRISDGLPATREDWDPSLLESLARFSTGDIVENPPLFYFADPSNPVWAPTKDFQAGSSGPEVIDADHVAPPFGIITSQTCDIGEVDSRVPQRPWISVAPVYDLDDLNDGIKGAIRKGRKGALFLVHVPALTHHQPGFWVADLRIEFPVEKGWFGSKRPIPGYVDEEASRALVERLSYLRSRPAWSEKVLSVAQPTIDLHLSELKSNSRDSYKEILNKVDLYARCDSRINPTYVQFALFVDGTLSQTTHVQLQILAEALEQASTQSGLPAHETLIDSLDDVSARTYGQFAAVPLQAYSPV